MKNLAGVEDCDVTIREELEAAGIEIIELPFANHPEVKSKILGVLNGWEFRRQWYYYSAIWKPPAPISLTIDGARKLHEAHGKEVRVAGHWGCPSPDEWWGKDGQDYTPNSYHIDTEEGLAAFVAAISGEAKPKFPGLTVGELIAELQKRDPDLPIWMSKDPEGNGFSPFDGIATGSINPADMFESRHGARAEHIHSDHHTDEECGLEPGERETFQKVLVFWP